MTRLVRLVIVFALFLGGWLRSAVALGPVDGKNLLPTDPERAAVGTLAPDFFLEDEKGAAVTLSQFREQKNVVLVFYRGHW